MIAVVEVDLGALGVCLPRGEVAMVIAQPHVVFVPQEPFTWAPAERQRCFRRCRAPAGSFCPAGLTQSSST